MRAIDDARLRLLRAAKVHGAVPAHIDVIAQRDASAMERYQERMSMADQAGLTVADGTHCDAQTIARATAWARGAETSLAALACEASGHLAGVTGPHTWHVIAHAPRPRDDKGRPMSLPDCFDQIMRHSVLADIDADAMASEDEALRARLDANRAAAATTATQTPTGEAPTGQAPTGQASTGQAPTGQAAGTLPVSGTTTPSARPAAPPIVVQVRTGRPGVAQGRADA